eukprot:CAMPEP_0197184944 /NCGR_PEP_ID=MMETSP1423-20130617/10913_1 /TAXON_ID=476441 /ORGANISM="Pseudo-nitzschia heimii, Strain UNC1101" /LENGTH=358 /DNA_ID=CAMNT_0042635897 /DNA_START=221 /DNA_END=1295 /DNA_ORIENTATION=-
MADFNDRIIALLVNNISPAIATTSAIVRASHRIPFSVSQKTKVPSLALDVARFVPRGGEGVFNDEYDEDEDEDEEDDNETPDIRQHPEYEKLQAYRMKQQVLLQLRATFLSEALAKRGLPIPSLRDVSMPDGKVPPKKVDWDCALSTEADPKHCLISYEPEPGSKLLVPMELASTDKWITLSALNRLRRDDPSKVEPMWSDKYAILSSWFGANSRYSLLQHVGPKGFVLSMLLDRNRLPTVAGLLLIFTIIQLLPIIEILANRFLVSGYLWSRWFTWHRYVHIGLPFKLLIVQTVFSYVSKGFSILVSFIKDKLVDLECQILEETIPLTVGEGSKVEEFEDIDIEEDGSSSSDDEEEV